MVWWVWKMAKKNTFSTKWSDPYFVWACEHVNTQYTIILHGIVCELVSMWTVYTHYTFMCVSSMWACEHSGYPLHHYVSLWAHKWIYPLHHYSLWACEQTTIPIIVWTCECILAVWTCGYVNTVDTHYTIMCVNLWAYEHMYSGYPLHHYISELVCEQTTHYYVHHYVLWTQWIPTTPLRVWACEHSGYPPHHYVCEVVSMWTKRIPTIPLCELVCEPLADIMCELLNMWTQCHHNWMYELMSMT